MDNLGEETQIFRNWNNFFPNFLMVEKFGFSQNKCPKNCHFLVTNFEFSRSFHFECSKNGSFLKIFFKLFEELSFR